MEVHFSHSPVGQLRMSASHYLRLSFQLTSLLLGCGNDVSPLIWSDQDVWVQARSVQMAAAVLQILICFVIILIIVIHVGFFPARSSGLTCAQGRLQKGRPPRAVPNLIHMRLLLLHWWSLFLWLLLLSWNPQWNMILLRVLAESGSMALFSTTAMISSISFTHGWTFSECSWYLHRVSTWLANLAARPRTGWFQSPLCLLSCRLMVQGHSSRLPVATVTWLQDTWRDSASVLGRV